MLCFNPNCTFISKRTIYNGKVRTYRIMKLIKDIRYVILITIDGIENSIDKNQYTYTNKQKGYICFSNQYIYPNYCK